ncbi:hypothetical protein EDB86DRAFT_3249651 [Lactarius hatsudake]|nr:hypothetical protein EDB86DRAFT_3249651 [Lactarius hatsudake]
MPRRSCKSQARARNAKIACRALHPLDARPPVAESGHVEAGTSQYLSREDLDPELASFCQRFNLEPRVQDFEDEDRDDAHDGLEGPGNSESDHDPSNEPEISGQSELDHFSMVLQHAQQIAIELEKEKERSRKRKTPRHYTGNSLKTSYRRKKTKVQLAEKGFLGVFEYLDLQKRTRATSVTAASITETSVPAANATGASMAAANATMATAMAASPLTASATASPSPTASATTASVSTTAVSTVAASVMAACATTTNATASSAMAMSTTAPNMTVTTVSAMTTTGVAATVVIAPNMPTAFDAALGASNVVTGVETVVVEVGVESCPNVPQQDDQASITVRASTPRPAWADNGNALVQGAGSDTSPKTVERSVETLPDEEEVSNNGSRDEENPICEEACRAVDAMLEDLHQRRTEMATGATPGDPLSAADWDLDLWNDRAALHVACMKLTGKGKDKDLNVVLRAWITAMEGAKKVTLLDSKTRPSLQLAFELRLGELSFSQHT